MSQPERKSAFLAAETLNANRTTEVIDDGSETEGHDVLVWVGLLGAAVFSLNAFIPIFSPLLTGLCSIWLMLGRFNVWQRIGVVSLAVLILGLGSAELYLLLVAIVLITAMMTFSLSPIISIVTRTPCRGSQFSLWQLGGLTIIMAVICGILRLIFEQHSMFIFDTNAAIVLTLQAIAVSTNIILGSLSVFMPERHRTWRLFYLSAISVLIVMPLIEIFVAFGFGWGWGMAALIELMHFGGALFLWLLLFPMELAGLFDVEVRQDDGPIVPSPVRDPLD